MSGTEIALWLGFVGVPLSMFLVYLFGQGASRRSTRRHRKHLFTLWRPILSDPIWTDEHMIWRRGPRPAVVIGGEAAFLKDRTVRFDLVAQTVTFDLQAKSVSYEWVIARLSAESQYRLLLDELARFSVSVTVSDARCTAFFSDLGALKEAGGVVMEVVQALEAVSPTRLAINHGQRVLHGDEQLTSSDTSMLAHLISSGAAPDLTRDLCELALRSDAAADLQVIAAIHVDEAQVALTLLKGLVHETTTRVSVAQVERLMKYVLEAAPRDALPILYALVLQPDAARARLALRTLAHAPGRATEDALMAMMEARIADQEWDLLMETVQVLETLGDSGTAQRLLTWDNSHTLSDEFSAALRHSVMRLTARHGALGVQEGQISLPEVASHGALSLDEQQGRLTLEPETAVETVKEEAVEEMTEPA